MYWWFSKIYWQNRSKTRLDKHDTKVDQPMYQHLSNCSAFNDHVMLFTLSDVATKTTIFTKELHLRNAVINNVKVLNKRDKRNQLQFLEACYIKTLIPEITSKHQKSGNYLNNSHIKPT